MDMDQPTIKVKTRTLKKQPTASSSSTMQVWHNEDSTRLMELFHTFGDHFKNTDLTTPKWIREHVHTHGGGVSID
jgi:hypothetical protein